MFFQHILGAKVFLNFSAGFFRRKTQHFNHLKFFGGRHLSLRESGNFELKYINPHQRCIIAPRGGSSDRKTEQCWRIFCFCFCTSRPEIVFEMTELLMCSSPRSAHQSELLDCSELFISCISDTWKKLFSVFLNCTEHVSRSALLVRTLVFRVFYFPRKIYINKTCDHLQNGFKIGGKKWQILFLLSEEHFCEISEQSTDMNRNILLSLAGAHERLWSTNGGGSLLGKFCIKNENWVKHRQYMPKKILSLDKLLAEILPTKKILFAWFVHPCVPPKKQEEKLFFVKNLHIVSWCWCSFCQQFNFQGAF